MIYVIVVENLQGLPHRFITHVKKTNGIDVDFEYVQVIPV
jgi:hypothetical protein